MSIVEIVGNRLRDRERKPHPDVVLPAMQFCRIIEEQSNPPESVGGLYDLLRHHGHKTRPGKVWISSQDYSPPGYENKDEQWLTITMLSGFNPTGEFFLTIPAQRNGDSPRLRFSSHLPNDYSEQQRVQAIISDLERQDCQGCWQIADWTVNLFRLCR